MSDATDLGWTLHLGPLHLGESLVLSWALSVLVTAVAWLGFARRIETVRLTAGAAAPTLNPWLEAAWDGMRQAVAEIVPSAYVDDVLPFIGTLWCVVLLSNLLGLVPGLSSPTRDLSITSALATLVFLAVHVYGVRAAGWRAHLRQYLEPSPILLPFHLISEVTRTLALAIRLFGNMMSLEMAALLVLMVAGLLVPVPLLLLHVIEALVQAYIFGILALIYIASALEAALPPDEGEAAATPQTAALACAPSTEPPSQPPRSGVHP